MPNPGQPSELSGEVRNLSPMTVATTVEIDDQGRLTVPKPVREALEIDGEEALIQLEIDVKSRKEAAE